MKAATVTACLLASCLPLVAWSVPPESGGIREEIRRDLEDARREIRIDLARARADLETGNLDVGNSLNIGDRGSRKTGAAAPLPKAEITPQGDFLIEGEAVALDPAQRQQLLAYRGLVIEVARAGIDIGEVSALAAVDSVDRGVFSLMVGAMTGSLERRIKRSVRDTVEPAVLLICNRVPDLREAQQQLASDLPAFQPYARLEAQDADACRKDVRREFAGR